MQAWGHPQVGRELGTRGRGAQGQGNMRAATTQGQWVQHVPHGSVPWGLLGVPTATPGAVTPLQGLSPGAGAVPRGLCCTVPIRRSCAIWSLSCGCHMGSIRGSCAVGLCPLQLCHTAWSCGCAIRSPSQIDVQQGLCPVELCVWALS